MVSVVVTGSAGRWEARTAGAVVGTVRAGVRPDKRCYLAFQDCQRAAYQPLLAAASSAFPQDLYTAVDETDRLARTLLGEAGFTQWRRELVWRIPVDPARFGLPGAPAPVGIDLVSAGDADLVRLRELDETIRADIPGGDGWRWEPAAFQEETFSAGYHPATYQVAVVRATGEYVGLLRVWLGEGEPRLGCLGVRRAYRGTRVVPALLGRVLGALQQQGYAAMIGETDETNRAVNALVARSGAERIGGSCHLVRRVGLAAPDNSAGRG